MSLLEDLELVWQTLGDELHAEHPAHDACVRIRAALADHEHLEEGARLAAIYCGFAGTTRADTWLAAEAKRKDETNG